MTCTTGVWLLVCALVASLAPGALANICVGYGKTECLAHSDECVLCRAFDRLDLCFQDNIAKKLPGSFNCNWPTPPEPTIAACDDLAQPACESTAGCVWCLSAAVPSQCYTEADARRLPAAVFLCKFPSTV